MENGLTVVLAFAAIAVGLFAMVLPQETVYFEHLDAYSELGERYVGFAEVIEDNVIITAYDLYSDHWETPVDLGGSSLVAITLCYTANNLTSVGIMNSYNNLYVGIYDWEDSAWEQFWTLVDDEA